MQAEQFSPDVIISSRVRFARNLVDYPFAPVLDTACRKEIIGKVTNATKDDGYVADSKISDHLFVHALAEKNIVSREFADDEELHALLTNSEKNTYIMVCEEDHIRIQSYSGGLNLRRSFCNALDVERLLDRKLRFAFDRELGYLTHCPTNLGTAMRASVMMFLPAITIANRMGDLKSQLEKIGMTIRGMYGEGSSADAYMYQISNQLSLGICEDDILRKTETIAKQIADDEIRSRKAVFEANKDVLTDKIMRSVGILKYATMISGKEFCECYAYARLGISLGIISEIPYDVLDKLLYMSMPANIIYTNKIENRAAEDARVRDRLRAETIRHIL